MAMPQDAPGSAGEALAVDERNPFWAKYSDLAAQVIARAKEPFEIGEGVTPAPGIAQLALRHAIRLALGEGGVGDAARRAVILEQVAAAAAPLAAGGAKLDAALHQAVLAALQQSGIETRWREAAAYQDAWERTETRASVLPRTARWLAQLWPLAVGIGVGGAVGMGGAFLYYYVIAPLSLR